MHGTKENLGSGTPGKRQLVIMISTLVILSAGFAYYFFGYVQVKEANLNEMGFRVLTRLGKNIVSKKENMIKNARNIIRVELKKKSNVSINQVNANQKAKGANKDINFIKLFNGTDSPVYPLISGYPGIVQVLDTVIAGMVPRSYSYSFDLENFLTPMIKNDVFDEFVLFNGDTTLFSTIQSGFELKEVDSLLDVRLGMQVSSVKEVEIGGISYQFFLQPHKVDINNTWVIGGLIQTNKFNDARMGVSPVIIMFIFLFTGLSLLSIPFLKLKLMSSMERLNVSDAIFASISLVLGTSIAVILMLHSYRLGGPDTTEQEEQLENFSDQVAGEFFKEIIASYDQLQEFDDVRDMFPKNDIVNISARSNTSRYGDSLMDLRAQIYPLFDQAFWTDKGGNQKIKWTTKSNTTNKINISQRNYFKNNLDNNSWIIDGKKFSLESIYSWNTGKSMVGLGTERKRKDDGMEVIALSSIFYSVIDPIVPQGYSFAIVDPAGLVWFHSDKERNLQENFIAESEQNPRLRSAIYSNSGSHVDIKYHGDNYDAFIHPLKGIPLYLIALRDQNYDRTTKAQTLNFTLLHVFLFFMFLTAMVLTSRLLRVSKSKLKRKELLFGWIWPMDRRKLVYQKIVIINVLVAVCLLLMTSFTSSEESVTLLYVSSIYCFMITYFKMNYDKLDGVLIKKHLIFSVVAGLLLLFITSYSLGNGFWMILIFQAIIIGILLFPKDRLTNSKWDTRSSYSLMLLSWIFLASILPSMIFYKISYNLEHELSAKHSQLAMARSIAEKTELWDNSDRTAYLSGNVDDLTSRGDMYGKHLYDSIYFEDQKAIEKGSGDKDNINVYTIVSSIIRPFYNEIVVENNDLVFDRNADSDWYWNSDDGLQLVYSNYRLKDNGRENKELVIHSSVPQFQMPSIFGSAPRSQIFKYSWINLTELIFWLLLLGITIGIYTLIRFTVRNVFVQRTEPALFEVDEKFFENDIMRKNVYIIGLPKCGKTRFIEGKFPSEEHKLTINLINLFYDNSWEEVLKKAIDPKVEVILVNQFEYNLENRELTQRKLELLERLLLFSEKKVIVSTTINISNIEELYTEDGSISAADREALYRWNELFKNFYEVYFPLQGFGRPKLESKKFNHQPAIITDLLDNEFNHGLYLEELKPEIERLVELNDKQGIATDYDQIVSKIQGLCSVYYHSLWSTCTESEKYIMYDLAEDGLVNAKNYQIIELLMHKGLVVYNGWLQIMNDSFRDFILNKIGPEEALRIEKKANVEGTWTSFRNPLIIVLLALAGFLIATQQDSINSMVSFLAPFLAIIPAAFRIISFSNKKKARSASIIDDD